MATARHDRRGRGFQGALLVSALIPLALAAEPEVPLRFGDPESALLEDAETTQAHPSDVLDDSEVSEKVTETFADPADRVRAVLASIPKGSPFPEQLDQMASMGPAAVPALQSALSDSGGQWELRWASAMALGRIATPQAVAALEEAATDKLFLVRMAAVKAMGIAGDPSGLPSIRKALSDPAMVVRAAAADTLGQVKDRMSVPLLLEELPQQRNFHRGRGLWVRENILEALGSIGDKRAVDGILGQMTDADSSFRRRACAVLARIETDAPPATEALDDGCAHRWTSWRKETSSGLGTP